MGATTTSVSACFLTPRGRRQRPWHLIGDRGIAWQLAVSIRSCGDRRGHLAA